MSVSAVAEAPALQAPSGAARLSLAPTAALVFASRFIQYIAFGVTGVILARGLGPDGRGIYGLINEAAAVAASFPGLGLEVAGIYLVGQRRFPLQKVVSNSLAWSAGIALIFAGLIATALMTGGSLLGMSSPELAIALAGAALIMICEGAVEFLMPLGRVQAYTAVKVVVPLVRLVGIAVLAAGIGLSVEAAAGVWVASIAAGAAMVIFFLSRDVRFVPGLDAPALRAQASFGSRIQFGWILQALNHRLDVFLIGYFVGTAGVGEYLVGVNLAELGWWVPLALGTVLFPKASAMTAQDNFKMSAAACRRTLLVTLVASAGLLVVVTPLIPVVYGSEFAPAATIFLILLPSGMLYTLHKVLGASLSANGRPQTTLIAGLSSLPATIALNLVLVPAWGIKGAAVASNIAYAINSSVILILFLRASGLRLRDVVLFNGTDLEAATWTARELWATKVLGRPVYSAALDEKGK